MYADRLSTATQAVSNGPDAWLIYETALKHAEAGRYREAMALYEELLSEPSVSAWLRARACNDLGVICERIGDAEHAEHFIRKAIFADTLFLEPYANLIQLNGRKARRTSKVSVVIPTYNRCGMLRESIDALRRNTYFPLEAIVVCDPCEDGTEAYLAQEAGRGGFVSIINETRRGTVGSMNQGLAAATGDYIGFLNDDAIVMPGWDLALVADVDSDESAGCAVPLVVYPDGTIQSPGQHNPYKSTIHPWIGQTPYVETARVARKSIEAFPEFQTPRACDYGYFMFLKRGCLDAVGLADESYPHYFADPDLGYRIQQIGYRLIYCPTSVIVHHELSRNDSALMRQRFDNDADLFIKKWGIYRYR